MVNYFIRLDDACPTMDFSKWERVCNILDAFNIKPIIAVVPNNNDPKLKVNEYNSDFWNRVKGWEAKGYHIAMHGYDHFYISDKAGLVPLNKRSEFANIDYQLQKEKIIKALEIFKRNDIMPKIWVAPAHSFDKTTLEILNEFTQIRIISDGISKFPFNKYDFFWIPVQLWKFKIKRRGIWTVCLHPNNMSQKLFTSIEYFIKTNCHNFPNDINDIISKYGKRNKSILDRVFLFYFFSLLTLKKLMK